MSERSIDETMAALIKGMILRGDPHDEIAAWFLINQGRCADLKAGRRYPEVTAAPPEKLPPRWRRSPYEAWPKISYRSLFDSEGE